MKFTLEDVKNCIDKTWGEFTGDITPYGIQCKFTHPDILEFYMWDAEVDDMMPIGNLDRYFCLRSKYRIAAYVTEIGNMEEYFYDDDTTIEQIVFIIFWTLCSDYTEIAERSQWGCNIISSIVHKKFGDLIDLDFGETERIDM